MAILICQPLNSTEDGCDYTSDNFRSLVYELHHFVSMTNFMVIQYGIRVPKPYQDILDEFVKSDFFRHEYCPDIDYVPSAIHRNRIAALYEKFDM